MRRLVTPRTRVAEISSVHRDGMYRGRLAEDYDGIGQYVLVNLAGSSVGSAFKTRVAAGDFGGSRIIPRGSPVVVHSYRGQLEVFLGNQPRVELCRVIEGLIAAEEFNRVVPVGLTLGTSEFPGNGPWINDTIFNEAVHVNGSQAVLHEADALPLNNILLQEVEELNLQLPLEIRVGFYVHRDNKFKVNTENPQLRWFIASPDFSRSVFLAIDWVDNSNGTGAMGDLAAGADRDGFEFGATALVIPLESVITLVDDELYHAAASWGFDNGLNKVKVWRDGDVEPDWQAVSPGSMSQNFMAALSGNNQTRLVGAFSNDGPTSEIRFEYIRFYGCGTVIGEAPPGPLCITDTLDRADQVGWGDTDTTGLSWVTLVGSPDISSNRGHLDSTEHVFLSGVADALGSIDETFEFEFGPDPGVGSPLLVATQSDSGSVSIDVAANEIRSNREGFNTNIEIASFSLSTEVVYKARVYEDYDLMRVKIWAATDVEPNDWLIENVAGPYDLVEDGTLFKSVAFLNAGNSEVWIDDLDILGVNNC